MALDQPERLVGCRHQLHTGPDLPEINALMSFAAPAERCASSRTSCATTAKPAGIAGARRLDAGH